MARLKIAGSSPAEIELGENVYLIPDGRGGLSFQDGPSSDALAVLQLGKNGYTVTNLTPGDGSLINNAPLASAPLRGGDILTIRGLTLIFEDGQPEAPAGKAASSADDFLRFDEVFPNPAAVAVKSNLDLVLEDLFSYEGRFLGNEARPDIDLPAPTRVNLFLLYQAARSLNSALPLPEALSRTLEIICSGLGAGRAAIYETGEKGLTPLALHQLSAGSPEAAVIRELIGRALGSASAIVCAGACFDPAGTPPGARLGEEGLSAVCVPLGEGEEKLGAIYLEAAAGGRPFEESEIDVISVIASQIGMRVRQERVQERVRESAIHKANLERFHSPDVARLILDQTKGGKEDWSRLLAEREVTILFADISDFTPLIERLDPKRAASLLNAYFDEMAAIIFKYKGTLDKFIGDAIMATFGAPISYGNDAELALFAAIEMMRQMEEFKRSRKPVERFNIRIGVNTGMVITGYLGSKTRIEYTVLGDAVNVAARLQHIAPPNTILAGEATYAKVGAVFKFKDHGEVVLKGKKKSTRVYEVIF